MLPGVSVEGVDRPTCSGVKGIDRLAELETRVRECSINLETCSDEGSNDNDTGKPDTGGEMSPVPDDTPPAAGQIIVVN